MRFNRILLVSPPSSSRYGGLRVPAGIGYVAQSLYDNGIEYEYIDMRIGHSFDDLKKKAAQFNPELIGISMITLEYKKTYQMIGAIKGFLPSARIVVGGHHTTILKEEVLRECSDIDFGVVSEGEETILDLCDDRVEYKNIEGLICREGPQVLLAGERPPLENLDEYAFPRYHRFNLKDYSRQIPVNSSRGCFYQCTFCPNKLIGRKYRARSVNHFVDEIEHWYGRGYRQIAIDDDNFTLDKDRVYRICDEIERRGLKGLFIRCSNGVRADRVDRRLLARMKEIGVRELGFGVDGGNNKVLAHLKKGETIETIERAVRDACDLGFDVKLFIIVGTPHETRDDIEDSIRLARRYPVARVNFNNAIPYPGTEMFEYVKNNNLFLVPPEEYLNATAEDKTLPVFTTPELSKEERIAVLARCHRVEKEVMRNTAYRMFKKYPVLGLLVKHLFVVDLFEKLFFTNLYCRKLFELIRYKKLMER
ncbi:MAG: radical SAM protein [Pseudomonadota bacterium]